MKLILTEVVTKNQVDEVIKILGVLGGGVSDEGLVGADGDDGE
jgi:hypothetical protein